MTTPEVLLSTLDIAVPLHMWELRDAPDELRVGIGREAAGVVGSHGDDLQFGGRQCAAAFNALARGLAALAYQPGGVSLGDRHWCTNHAQCVEAEEEARRRPRPVVEVVEEAPPRPVVTVYLPGDGPGGVS